MRKNVLIYEQRLNVKVYLSVLGYRLKNETSSREDIMRVLSILVFGLFCLRYYKSAASYTLAWYEKDDFKFKETAQLGPINPSTVPRNTSEVFMEKVPKIEAISGLENLRIITVLQSNITLLPRTIGALPNLRSIKLIENSKLYIESGAFQGLPVTGLEIARNFMTTLEDGVFLYLLSLQSVILDQNFIKEWNPNAFLKTPKMKVLSLNGNDVKYLPADSFRNLKNLKILLLSDNLIETIHEDAFRGLNNLDKLDLSGNHLVTLPKNLFAPRFHTIFEGKKMYKMRKIATLNLNKNHLSFLSDKILSDLSETNVINTRQNPWKCACYFKITNWARSHKITVDEIRDNGPICVASQKTCVEKISCDFIKDYYVRYPHSKRPYLFINPKRSPKQYLKENFFQHLNRFCNLSLSSQ